MPTWLKVTLGIFAILFVLGVLFGATPDKATTAAQPAGAGTPSVLTYTVTNVLDGDQIYLRDPTGIPKTVRAAGIDAPTTSYCWGPETAKWATTFLAGKQVTIRALNQATETLAAITLPDGSDYSTQALRYGYAKYVAGVADSTYAMALQTAENAAHAANTGLWGAPCLGTIDAPTPAPATTTPPPPPPTSSAPKPTTTKTTPPTTSSKEDEDEAVFYRNCTEVRAAGAAPLHIGEPGYRPALDRDHDGVACE